MRSLSFLGILLAALFAVSQTLSAQAPKEKEPDKSGQPPSEIGGKKLEQWITEISDKDPSIRQTAIRTVVQFGPPAKKAVPAIVARLARETDGGVKADAAAALSLLPLDKEELSKEVEGLRGLLSDSQRNVRLQAIITLSHLGTDAKAALPSLAICAADLESWEVRKACCYCLGRIGADPMNGPDSRAMIALTSRLTAPDPCVQVRLEAIMALSNLGPSPRPAEVTDEKAALKARMDNDHDKVVALWARVLLMFLDKNLITEKGLATVAKHLEDPDPRVRAQAARAIGTLNARAKERMGDLISALKDRDPEVTVSVIQAIGMFGDSAGNAAVTAVVDLTKDPDARIRYAALRALGALKAKGNLNDITAELKSKDPDSVLAAIDALFMMGELAQPALAQLQEVTKGENEVLKGAASATIDHIQELARKK
jgi:HEAT repeat protein